MDKSSLDSDYIWDLEEAYEDRIAKSKATNRSIVSTRTKYINRNHKTRVQELHERAIRIKGRKEQRLRRRIEKQVEQTTLLCEAKNAKSCRVENWQAYYENRRHNHDDCHSSTNNFLDDDEVHRMNGTSQLAGLGIEDKEMYDRLAQILSGDEISPEDYDALLQLDSTVAKPTLELDTVNACSEVIRVDDKADSTLQGASCVICLHSFDAEKPIVEVRKLPCGHVFCKGCIDQWLTSESTKCPELSCFWSSGSSGGLEPSALAADRNDQRYS